MLMALVPLWIATFATSMPKATSVNKLPSVIKKLKSPSDKKWYTNRISTRTAKYTSTLQKEMDTCRR